MADNVLRFIFESRNADKVATSSEELAKALEQILPAGDRASAGLDEVASQADRTEKELDEATEATDTTGSKLGQVAGDIGKMAAGFALAQVGIQSVTAALGTIRGAITGAITAASEQEQANVRVAFSLQSIGAYSQAAVTDLQQFAAEMQKVTAFSDDQVLSLAAVLAQIGKLRGDDLKQVTRLALDMSAALGHGTEQLGILLGKAAVGETAMLSRYGIIIDQTLPKAERLQAVIQQLNEKFGGQAIVQADTYAGSVAKMGNAWGELAETLGNTFLPALTKVNLAMASMLGDWNEAMTGMAAATDRTVPQSLLVVIDYMQRLQVASGQTRQELAQTLTQLQKQVVTEWRLQVQKGDLDAVMEQLGQFDEILERGFLKAGPAFEAFMDKLRREAEQGLELRVGIQGEAAERNLRAALDRLRGEATLDVLIQGTPKFQQARAELEQLGTSAPEGIDINATVSTTDVDRAFREMEQAQLRLAELQQRAAGGDTSTELIVDTDKAVENVDRLTAAYEEAVRSQSYLVKSTEELTKAATAEGTEREIIATVSVRINRAKTEQDIQTILQETEQEFLAAKGEADRAQDMASKANAESLKRVAEAAQQLAAARKAMLDASKPSSFQAQGPPVPAGEIAGLREANDLALKLNSLVRDMPAIERIIQRDALRDITDSSAALDTMRENMDRLITQADPAALVTAYGAMREALEANRVGTVELDQATKEWLEKSLEQITTLLPNIEAVSEAMKKAGAKGGKDAKDALGANLGTDLARDAFRSVGRAWELVMADMITGSKTTGDAIAGIFKSMISQVIAMLAKLAALHIFKLLLNFIQPGLGTAFGAVVGLNKKPEIPQPTPGAPTKPASGLPTLTGPDLAARPLVDAVGEFTAASQLLVANLQSSLQPGILLAPGQLLDVLQPQGRPVGNTYIQAMDALTFQEWIRAGDGGKALSALAATGRLPF